MRYYNHDSTIVLQNIKHPVRIFLKKEGRGGGEEEEEEEKIHELKTVLSLVVKHQGK